MVIVIRTIYTRGLNKSFGLKFRVGSQVWQETLEEGRRTNRPKREYNNKDEDNSPNTLNDKNYQASSPQFRQVKHCWLIFIACQPE